jgi:hypothetical protein
MGIGVIESIASADEVNKAETASHRRQDARRTTKPAAAEKEPAKELLAAKDRTKTLLGMLGYKDLKTKKQYEDLCSS